MGHFINQELLESYEDDLITHSVQGVYQGTMTAPQEIALDKKLLQERLARQQLQQKKEYFYSSLLFFLATKLFIALPILSPSNALNTSSGIANITVFD